ASLRPTPLPTTRERKPRTLCGCQPVACCNSAAVASPSRWIRARIVAPLPPCMAADAPLLAAGIVSGWAGAAALFAFFADAACFVVAALSLPAVFLVSAALLVVFIVVRSFVLLVWDPAPYMD